MKQICFDTIDSTNTYLKNNYQQLDNLTFVSAKYQTNGKGRNSRNWYSDGNDLLFSLLLKDKSYLTYYKQISIVSAYSIIEVLLEYEINNLSIKWPNDVYVADKKICGILLEGISHNELDCLVVGIGLNVNQGIFENDYLTTPTSMKLILNKQIDLEVLKQKVYQKLNDNLVKLINNYNFYQDITKYDYLKDKSAYALINEIKKEIKVVGINEDYSLRVIADGKILNLESGEISFHI